MGIADERLRVYVYSKDVLVESGLRAQLSDSGRVALERCPSQAEVAILAWPELDDDLARRVCQLRHSGCQRILLVMQKVDTGAMPRFLETKASGVLRSSEASPEGLINAAFAVASDGGYLPPDLAGHLLRAVHNPGLLRVVRHASAPRLSGREEAVIRLLAEGFDTHQIAEELHYSERTIKGVVHQVIRRYGLRNRSHAVAFALRNDLI